MARTKDSTTGELAVAHAALRFITERGLLKEFYSSGALTGALCNDQCIHEPGMLEIKQD